MVNIKHIDKTDKTPTNIAYWKEFIATLFAAPFPLAAADVILSASPNDPPDVWCTVSRQVDKQPMAG